MGNHPTAALQLSMHGALTKPLGEILKKGYVKAAPEKARVFADKLIQDFYIPLIEEVFEREGFPPNCIYVSIKDTKKWARNLNLDFDGLIRSEAFWQFFSNYAKIQHEVCIKYNHQAHECIVHLT